MFDDLIVLEQNSGAEVQEKEEQTLKQEQVVSAKPSKDILVFFRETNIRVKSSYRKMGDRAIHPNICMNFSQAQYDNRQKWNAYCG